MLAITRSRAAAAATIGLAAAVAPVAGAARKDIPSASAAACDPGAAAPVFAPFGDTALYALAPQGDLAASDGWSLDGASLSADRDPWSGSAGSVALAGGGAQAASAPMCVTAATPTIRFFARDAGAARGAFLRVDLLAVDAHGNEHRQALARFRPSADWSPSPVIPLGIDFRQTPMRYVRVIFRADGARPGESLGVDGLFLDPFAWH